MDSGRLLPLALADELREGLVVIDRDSVIQYANPAMTRIFGYGRDELEGESLTVLMPEEHRDRHQEAIDQYLATGERHLPWSGVELPGRHRDGHRLDLRISFTEFTRQGKRLFAGTIRDLTAARDPEEERRIQVRSYRALFEEDVAAVFRVGSDGRVLDVNGALARLAGYGSPEELTGEDATDLFADCDDRSLFVDDLRNRRAVRNQELPLRRADGTTRWTLVNAVWIDDPGAPRPEVLIGTVVDISDRRHMEWELARSEERYRRLFEQDVAGVYRSDAGRGGRILECNQAFADIFGYRSPDEVVGTPARAFLPDESDDQDRQTVVETIRRQGAIVRREARLRRKDGRTTWALVHARLVEDPEHGEVLEGMIVDVSERVRAREELAEREERFRQLAEHIEEIFWLTTPEKDEMLYVNPAYEEITGRSRESLHREPLSWLECVHPEDRSRVEEALPQQAEGTYEETYRIVRPDGEVRWLHDRAFPVENEEGDVYRIVGIAQDVTEQERAREALERAKEKFEGIFTISPVALKIVDPETEEYLEVNRAFEEVFGRDRDALLSGSVDEDALWEDPTHREHLYRRVRQGQSVRREEVRLRREDGTPFDGLFSASDLELAGSTYLVAAIEDVSELKQVERELEHRALHDQLTGLPNRTLFGDRMEHALDRSARTGEMLAVLFLDLDGFKRVNDLYGHGEGDEVLRQLGSQLGEGVREQDTVARVGGDEFGVLVEDLDDEEAAREVADRLLGILNAPFEVAGDEVFLDGSCGITYWSGEGSDRGGRHPEPGALLRQADLAMYAAKEQPGSRWRVFGPEVEEAEPRPLKEEMRLRRGIEESEFVPHYQPVIRLADGRCVGAEALARWQDPDRGLVPPAEFIPLAEETGLIVELGHQVSRAAWRDLLRWKAEGLVSPEFRLRLNLSARQLEDPGIVESVEALLRAEELESRSLAFEITESAAMSTAQVTARLRELGVGLSIDDFGTEYATLERLVSLDVDSLKLDRRFVKRVTESGRHASVVEATLSLASALDIPAIAEGVETAEQLERLRELGCQYAQGFLFARPAPAQRFTEWLEEGRSWMTDAS